MPRHNVKVKDPKTNREFQIEISDDIAADGVKAHVEHIGLQMIGAPEPIAPTEDK